MKKSILLKNGSVFDTEHGNFQANTDVLIEGETIATVGKNVRAEGERVTEIDCSGKFILPGLFECHAHLTVLTNQPDEEKKEILEECAVKGTSSSEELDKQVLREFVNKGITQMRDCGGPLATLKGMKEKISQGRYVGPELLYAGPMLEKSPLMGEETSKRWPGFAVAVDTERDAENIIEQIANQGGSLAKTFNKFDVPTFKHLLNQARAHNLPVTHDPGTTFFHSIPVDRAIDLGIRCIEHGKSPWYVVLKDDLRLEHDSLMDADPQAKGVFTDKVFSMEIESVSLDKLRQLTERMGELDVFLCPTLHIFKYYAEHPEKFNEKEPEKFGKRFRILYRMACFITRELARGGTKILVGHDGWNPVFTLNEMRELKEIGLSESEIIRGATAFPAKWLGVTNQFGSILPNKRANILILSKNPLEDSQNLKSAHMVLLNGRIISQKKCS